ncbi:MAG: TetR family transcriptional regulator [Leucobacter sp.]
MQIVDHDERRRGIVEAAKRLILAGGFSAATMRTIAAEAGYANGALKYYFPAGKEAIVVAAFQSVLEEIEMRATVSAADEPLLRLRRYLRSWFPVDAADIPRGRVLIEIWEYATSSETVAELYAGYLIRWREQIEEHLLRAYASEAIRRRPPYEAIADEYLSFLMGSVVMNLIHPEGDHLASVDAYLEELLARLQRV